MQIVAHQSECAAAADATEALRCPPLHVRVCVCERVCVCMCACVWFVSCGVTRVPKRHM